MECIGKDISLEIPKITMVSQLKKKALLLLKLLIIIAIVLNFISPIQSILTRTNSWKDHLMGNSSDTCHTNKKKLPILQ